MRAASSSTAWLARLRQGRWFSELDDGFQHALLAAARVRPLVDDERLFARGDAPDGLYAIIEGAVRVTAVSEAGKELLLTRVEAPGWFGEIAVFDRQPRTHDCIANGDAVVLHIPLPALDGLLAAEPVRWRDLGLLVASKLRLTFEILEDSAHLPLALRLGRRLLVLAGGHGEWRDQHKRVLDVTQEQLASMLSASRQSVNQALKDLEQRGIVKVSYGQIELLDVERLTSP
jgi:CRP/FNR family cyclic AMP-dependent transcriptional regulator